MKVSVTLKELGLDHPDGYHITDLYDDYDYGVVTPDRRFKVDVNPSGSECNGTIIPTPSEEVQNLTVSSLFCQAW